MKHRLNDEEMSDSFFDSTRILGISSTLKNYQLCWHIEKTLQYNFETSLDLQIPLEKNKRTYSFTVYEYIDKETATEHFLYSNKNDGEPLIQELQHLDFIWLLKGSFFFKENEFVQLQQKLKTISGVQMVLEVPQQKIKSKDNLQL